MRQASWNEMFAPREGPPAPIAEVPEEPQGWRRLFWWEDLLTFALLGVVFLSVVASIDRANWADEMPSLFPIALLGLLMGALLARLRWLEGFIHLLALPIGAAASLTQILLVLPGATPWGRFELLVERMDAWFGVAFGDGISNDTLPLIVLNVTLIWLAAYLSAWAVFRWQNAWLAIIPGGWAILMNISYLPGQFSFSFVVFLFAGALLLARLHLLGSAQRWRQDGTPYPGFLSLSVLHVSFWAVLLLLVLAWLLPRAGETGPLSSAWQRATAPIAAPFQDLGRLFVGVNVGGSVRIHSYPDELPFLGGIELPDRLMLDVTTGELELPLFLREQAFDIYTSTGWRREEGRELLLEAHEITGVDRDLTLRETVVVRIVSTGNTGDFFFTIGQIRRSDRPGTIRWRSDPSDVTGLEAVGGLAEGTVYDTVGSISIATEDDLRSAGYDYPNWIYARYVQLPDDFPDSIRALARDVAGNEPSSYDRAVAVEAYLRTIPYDLDVPDTPVGRDAIEYFLFESRRGYFDYHASAMVVMLRSLGIPSRLATGYVLQPSERQFGTNRILVTEESVFAWPEVYFPGLGWVEFNPTPNQPLLVRPGAVEEDPDGSDDGSPGFGGDLNFEDLLELFPEEGTGGFVATPLETAGDRNVWPFVAIAGSLAIVIAVAAGGARYAWVRGLGGLEPPARLWGQTLRLASWARLAPAATETPREYARSLQEQVAELQDTDLLAEAYVRHRYGRQESDPAERERLEGAWRNVRGRLLRRLLRLR